MAEAVETPVRGRPWWVTGLFAGAVIGGLILLFRELPVALWIESFKTYVAGRGAWGIVLFGLVYAGVSLIPGGPAALLTLAAGALFGLVTGTVTVSLASTAGATMAFLLARTAFRQRVERLAAKNPRFRGLYRAIERQGAKIVALVRLSPVFPFTYVNYLFGLTPVKPVPYVLASWAAMLPGTLAYVYLGYSLGAATGAASPRQKAIQIALGVAAVVATAWIARIAVVSIRKAGLEEERAGPGPDSAGSG
ncbi:MAG: TVP38/TMEM64 family protein [Thermoanaerobaculia bacterium]|nr:TVP38/TMEM64 family protein [Thermoanaerobaculia bacterium]